MKFRVIEREEYTVVHLELEKVLTTESLRKLKPPKVNLAKGVVLSGRGPIWLYCFLVHHYHPAAWIATYDPRLGAVIVQTHHPKYRVGETVQIDEL